MSIWKRINKLWFVHETISHSIGPESVKYGDLGKLNALLKQFLFCKEWKQEQLHD